MTSSLVAITRTFIAIAISAYFAMFFLPGFVYGQPREFSRKQVYRSIEQVAKEHIEHPGRRAMIVEMMKGMSDKESFSKSEIEIAMKAALANSVKEHPHRWLSDKTSSADLVKLLLGSLDREAASIPANSMNPPRHSGCGLLCQAKLQTNSMNPPRHSGCGLLCQFELQNAYHRVRKFEQEQRYSEIIKEVAGIRRTNKLQIKRYVNKVREIHGAELSGQSLINMLVLYEYVALAKTGTKAKELSQFVSEYLDDRELLATHLQDLDPTDSVLRYFFDNFSLDFKKAYWETYSVSQKFPYVLGGTSDLEGITVYIKGSNHRIRAISLNDGKLKVVESADMWREFNRRQSNDLKRFSTDGVRFLGARKHGKSTEIRLGDSAVFEVTEAQLLSLKQGKALPTNHPLSKTLNDKEQVHILYSNPLQRVEGPYQEELAEFGFAVRKSYPSAHIYRDPPSPETAKKGSRLPAFEGGAMTDVVAVLADESFGVEDGKVVRNIEQDLQHAHIPVVHFKAGVRWLGVRGRGVIVITGHQSAELASFVTALGDAGFIEGNFVIFNSCQAALTLRLISEMNEKYGAAGTFSYEGKISAANVENTFAAFASEVAVANAQQQSRSFDDFLKIARKHGLNGIWIICHNIQQRFLQEVYSYV